MKVLELEGKLVRAKGDLSEFTVRFEKNVKYMRKERLYSDASLFQDRDWVRGVIRIKDIDIVVDWSGEEPKGVLEVTFTANRRLDLDLNPVVLFYLAEDEEPSTFEVAV